MDDNKINDMLLNYLLWNPIVNDTKKYDPTTDEGYKNAVELIAAAKQSYENSSAKPFFDTVLQGSFNEFLDSLYKEVHDTHEAAVAEREKLKQVPDFEKLPEVDKKAIDAAIDNYLQKYDSASKETIAGAKNILEDFAAWVVNMDREASKINPYTGEPIYKHFHL